MVSHRQQQRNQQGRSHRQGSIVDGFTWNHDDQGNPQRASLPPAYDDDGHIAAFQGYPYTHAHHDSRNDDGDDDDDLAEYLDSYATRDTHRTTAGGTGARFLTAPPPQDYRRRRSSATTGLGAGLGTYGTRRPSTIPDTPSMYTDPHEYQSTAGHTVMSGTIAGTQVFAGGNVRGQHEEYDHDDAVDGNLVAPDRDRGLLRKDTLRPGDSISAYNVPIAGSRASEDRVPPLPSQYLPNDARPKSHYGHAYSTSQDADNAAGDGYYTYHRGATGDPQAHHRYDSSATAAAAPMYNNNDYGYTGAGAGADKAGPYTASDYYQYPSSAYPQHAKHESMGGYGYSMAYADDEHDQDRQMKEAGGYYDHGYAHDAAAGPPGLFSNQMADVGAVSDGHGKGAFDDEYDEEHMSKRGLLGFKKESLQTQIDKRARGIGRQKWPIVTWLFAVAYVAVFIVELIKAKNETGQAIQTKPYLNPMIGPSTVFQISFGARFVPCMRHTPAVPLTTSLVCPSASTKATDSYSSSDICPLWQICGLPNDHTYGQQYRLITAMFLHAGFVHILFNLIVQLTLCAQIEKLLGSVFYTLVYVLGGLGGNLLGGNFGLVASPSVGASGAIYSCIAVELIDLIYNWRYEIRAKTRLVLSVLFTLLGLGLGLLPGLDNFAHIGGLAVGLLGGLALSPSIHETRRHRVVIWVLRLVGVALCVAYFVALGLNFYKSDDPTKACTWCRYLSCLPTFNQCKNNGLSSTATTTTGTSTNSRRDWGML
ncbi:unnamed protein product [Parajaminaea phylloscopi]